METITTDFVAALKSPNPVLYSVYATVGQVPRNGAIYRDVTFKLFRKDEVPITVEDVAHLFDGAIDLYAVSHVACDLFTEKEADLIIDWFARNPFIGGVTVEKKRTPPPFGPNIMSSSLVSLSSGGPDIYMFT
jgi:hypothetical protein